MYFQVCTDALVAGCLQVTLAIWGQFRLEVEKLPLTPAGMEGRRGGVRTGCKNSHPSTWWREHRHVLSYKQRIYHPPKQPTGNTSLERLVMKNLRSAHSCIIILNLKGLHNFSGISPFPNGSPRREIYMCLRIYVCTGIYIYIHLSHL